MGLDCVFLVPQSDNKDASRLVLPTRGTPEWCPFGFTKQFLEGVFPETQFPRRDCLKNIARGRLSGTYLCHQTAKRRLLRFVLPPRRPSFGTSREFLDSLRRPYSRKPGCRL